MAGSFKVGFTPRGVFCVSVVDVNLFEKTTTKECQEKTTLKLDRSHIQILARPAFPA